MIKYKTRTKYDTDDGKPHDVKTWAGHVCDCCGKEIDDTYIEIDVHDIGGCEPYFDQEKLNNPNLSEDVDLRDLTWELLCQKYHFCDPTDDSGTEKGCSNVAAEGDQSLVFNLLDSRIKMLNEYPNLLELSSEN